ncbi:MAG TPA: cyclic nucleotide-binding domain-containing protein [Myxococcales bacterium]|nr:cyclic nucleotide-binding domain-containing protein [Myxococcales bacterium]
MDAVRALRQVFIFKDVPDPVLEMVAGAAEDISVNPGETFLSPGDTPNALFVIRSGTVRLVPDRANAPSVLFGTGETIGEISLIDGAPFAGSATALERADLLVIRAGRLSDTLAGKPEAAVQLYRAIAKSLAGRLRRAVDMITLAKERH